MYKIKSIVINAFEVGLGAAGYMNIKPQSDEGIYVVVDLGSTDAKLVGEIYPILCYTDSGMRALNSLISSIVELCHSVSKYTSEMVGYFGYKVKDNWNELLRSAFESLSNEINESAKQMVESRADSKRDDIERFVIGVSNEIANVSQGMDSGNFAITWNNSIFADVFGIPILIELKRIGESPSVFIEKFVQGLGLKYIGSTRLISPISSIVSFVGLTPVININLRGKKRMDGAVDMVKKYAEVIREAIMSTNMTEGWFWKRAFLSMTGELPKLTADRGSRIMCKLMEILDHMYYYTPILSNILSRRTVSELISMDYDDLDLMHKILSGYLELGGKMILVSEIGYKGYYLISVEFDEDLRIKGAKVGGEYPREFINSVHSAIDKLVSGGEEDLRLSDLDSHAKSIIFKRFPELSLIY